MIFETDECTVGNGNQTAARLNSHDRAERDRTKNTPWLRAEAVVETIISRKAK